MSDTDRYRIIRMYQNSRYGRRIIKRGLTLDEAQAHCSDPETCSTTCKRTVNVRRTAVRGPWFDGYEGENAYNRSDKEND